MKRKTGIIVALDVSSLKEAEGLVEMLASEVDAFKIGMQLCTAEGVEPVVKAIHAQGGDVFLDLKYHDIPNTVAAAVKVASDMGIWMLNMHVSAGVSAMKAAAKAKSSDTKLIGVTVLTSLDDIECREVYGESARTTAGNFIQLAHDARLDGAVCSPHELSIIKQLPEGGMGFLAVTPGIRPEWSVTGDQKRFTTPAQALSAGSDYMVIGRPITAPPDDMTPLVAVRRIKEETSCFIHP